MVAPLNNEGERVFASESWSAHTQCDSSDGEVALDLKGRKHVGQKDNADGVYFLDVHASSTHATFPNPGAASAQALRNFLEARLPHNLITDEYGFITPIAQISDGHLPSLQAQVWRNKREDVDAKSVGLGDSKCQVQVLRSHVQHHNGLYAVQKPSGSQDALLLAPHATLIAELLEANHIFIIHNKQLLACELPTCQTRFHNHPSTFAVVTIEPLIHWGTVTAVTDIIVSRGLVQAFRRDGEICSNPLWTLAMKRFTPEHPPAFCVECLELLMDRSMEAWDVTEPRKECGFTTVNAYQHRVPQARGRQIDEDPEDTEHKRAKKYVAGVSRAAVGDSNWRTAHASLRLDGACDSTPTSQRDFHGDSNNTDKTRLANSLGAAAVVQGFPGNPTHRLSIANSLNRQIPFTDSLGMCVDTLISNAPSNLFHSAQVNPSPAIAWKPSISKILNSPKSPRITKNNTKISRAAKNIHKSGTSGNRGTKREFGQELDTNAIVGPRKKPSSTRLKINMSKMDATGTENIGISAPTTVLSEERIAQFLNVQSVKATPTNDWFDRSSDSSSTSLETTTTEGSQASAKDKASSLKMMPPSKKKAKVDNKAQPATTKSRTAYIDQSSDSSLTSLETKTTKSSKSREQVTQTAKPLSRKPLAKSLPKSKNPAPQPTFTPFTAKRPLLDSSQIPPTISPQAYLAHHTRIPSATEIICTCRRPALTPSVQLAQCSNPLCAIDWLHYDCLDKSGKISSRFGRLVCQHCRNEAYFKEQMESNGWTVGGLVERECSVGFDGRDDVGGMPMAGGGYGVVKPYGLGVEDVQEVLVKEKGDAGALGGLGFFGLAASTPFLVNEAYVHGTAGMYLTAPVVGGEDGWEEEEDEEGYWGKDEEGFYEEEEEMDEIEEMEVEDGVEDMDMDMEMD
ncbi:hypothetical protein CC86DRAFT_405014 [Ophiobolus disseminans]|uniref:Zinc finger PHD-type domain-containing protein n=1 Tax=Ophiobolus disseminans TaxID=1469910 RepID=A0A6A7A4B4_9PLEO|nr:hypothetical protein CC86DRAFT_405014 [Ophiobolus disseminans]